MGQRHDEEAYDLGGIDADIAPRLRAMVSPRRVWHSKQVADLAVSLARRWALDEDAARRAGLLHDFCRNNRDEWLAMASAEGIPVPNWIGEEIGHLHGPLAAIIARREFGLPEAWCRAIARHTTGGPEVTREVMVLYVADHACEGRHDPQVPHWRDLAHNDLVAATVEVLTHLLQSLLSQGHVLWPPSVKARNTLLLRHR